MARSAWIITRRWRRAYAMSETVARRVLKRRDYAFDLMVVTPLHLGAGVERRDLLDPVRDASGEEGHPAVSMIQRDANGTPWLPGSALKGALRALATVQHENLFGVIKHSQSNLGAMGALMVRGAPMIAPGSTDGLRVPRDPEGRALTGAGVYVSARTAIDDGRGVAHANKLFHAEMVAPGARFAVRLRLETPGDVDAQEAALARLLKAWTAPEGAPIGADAASGLGRVRIDGAVTRTPWAPDARGALVEGDPAAFTLPDDVPTIAAAARLRLTCEGPFLTRDPWPALRETNAETSERTNVIRALRLDDAPFITGQAISGALRSRLAWLIARESHRGNALYQAAERRLFGEIGRRGTLTVMVEGTGRKADVQTTSVRLDRFSGGPIDNALFTVDADLRVTIDLRLMLDRRVREADAEAKALKLLVDDVTRNGLMLGHGVNRGFGWFRAEVR